jgi:hypothetical protein
MSDEDAGREPRVPDFDRDVVVERHVLSTLATEAVRPPAWSVWAGQSVVHRTDDREEALAHATRLARQVQRPLWLCEHGRDYDRVLIRT